MPSDHADKKVPILDLKCWVQEVDSGDNKNHLLLHEFFMKDVSSKAVIHREAAMQRSGNVNFNF